MRHTCVTQGVTHHESRSTEDDSMFKFILLVLSVFIALVAAAHTVHFISYGDYLEGIITGVYFFASTFLAAALIELKRTQS